MAKIEVRCPKCSKWENIEVSDDATKNLAKGLLAININAGMICEHNFIAYVDKNFMVRDCLIADFEIQVSDSIDSQEVKENISSEVESINHDLIKLNVPEILMASIFRAIFLGKSIIIISDDQFIANHIIHFFKYVMENLFGINIIAMSKIDYKNNRENFENFIIFEKRKVINDRDNIIAPKKIVIEKGIARKFLEEYELITGLIILRNEIQKVFEYSKTLADFIKNSEEKVWTSKILIDHIKEVYNEQIQVNYLKFLSEIVTHYFKVQLPDIKGVSNFLGFL
ncbi:MAG: hypothetical protein ACFFA3_06175 [Promethearchaeota archaeon]